VDDADEPCFYALFVPAGEAPAKEYGGSSGAAFSTLEAAKEYVSSVDPIGATLTWIP